MPALPRRSFRPWLAGFVGAAVLTCVVPAVAANAAGGLASAAPAPLPATVKVEAGGHVLQLLGPKRVLLNRGRVDGLRADARDLSVHPMRVSPGSNTTSLDMNIRLAKARVVELHERTAVLELSVVAGLVRLGDYVNYVLDARPELAEDALFEVALVDIVFRTLASEAPMYTLADLLADPRPAARDALLDGFLAEIKAQAELAKQVLTTRIEGGRFHGRTLSDAFHQSQRADVVAFFEFVRAFPGKYIGKTWKFVETYATWIINRTPTGDRYVAERKARPLQRQAAQAAARGDFAEAEKAWRAALQLLPDSTEIQNKLKALQEIRIWREALQKDPDDTATRWKLLVALYAREAWPLVAAELDRLEQAGYKLDDCLRYRGYLAVRQREYAKGIAIFDRILAKDPKSAVATWRDYADQMQKLQADPKAFAAAMALGRVNEADKAWDAAGSRYREALDLARTPAEFAAARAGQERIARLDQLDDIVGWARAAIESHDLAKARERVEQIVAQCKLVGDDACAPKHLNDLAEKARDVWEEELGLELHRRRVELLPADTEARCNLAWALHVLGRQAEARIEVEAALQRDPDKAYAHQILARIHLLAGDPALARKHAGLAARDPKYAWPLLVLARIEAAEGRYAQALDIARKGHAMMAETSEFQELLQATWLAAQAYAELAAGRDVERNRLRLVRALVQLELPAAAARETAALPARSPHRRAARQAVAESGSALFTPHEIAAALREAGATTPWRQRRLALFEAQAALLARPADADARLRLARAYVADGQFHRALATLGPTANGTPAADVAEAARRGTEADTQNGTGTEANLRGDFATAEKLHRQAHATFAAIGCPGRASGAAWWLTGALLAQGRHQAARDFYQPLLAGITADGQEMATLDAGRKLADIEASLGSLDAQAKAFERTRQVCEADDRVYCLGQVHIDLAGLLASEGRHAAALDHARQARTFAAGTGVGRLERDALFTEADVRLVMGDLPLCQKLAEELLAGSRATLDALHERYALMLLGAVAMRRGDAATARNRFGEVYELGQRTGETWVRAMARLFEGRAALFAAHDPKAAKDLLAQAAALAASRADQLGEARALLGLGQAQTELGELEPARKSLQKALAVARAMQRPLQVARTQTEIAHLEVQGKQAAAAVAAAQEAARLTQQLDSGDERWTALHALGKALDAAGRADEALAALEKAVAALVDATGRAGGTGGGGDGGAALAFGRSREVFRDAIDLCVRSGNTTRALELLELSRDADLRRLFDPGKVKARDAKLRGALALLEESEAQVSASRKALNDELAKPAGERNEARVEALAKVAASTDGEMRQLLLRLKRDHRQVYALLAIDPESIADLRDALPPDTIVLEYFLAGDALYAFVVARDKDKPRAFRIPVAASEVEKAVFEYRQALENRPDQALPLARKLHAWLVAPVEAEMAKVKTTLIVPFGPLFYLPFQALATVDDKGKATYVLEKHRIGYLSSATLFKMLKRGKPASRQTMLAFANPDGTLPGARSEVERVKAKSFPEARVLFEKEATKERFFELAGQYGIVHFATHGILAADALASHLKMATAPLTVDEITGFEGLEGKTDLVVLSACQTAIELGRSTGDELISIASAFATAGAPALVASLWEVDDESTAELMTRFYELLRTRKDLDTLEALRQAQLHVLRLDKGGLRPFAEPAYWAAFQLIGDFR